MIEQPLLGKRLLELRIAQGITQQELRDKCHVSVRTIQRIESGSVTPRVSTVKILIEMLGEDPADWFGASEVHVENKLSIKTFKKMLLINATEEDQKNALTPAWIAGIVYLLIGIIEIGLEMALDEEILSMNGSLTLVLGTVKVITIISFFLFTKGFLSLSLLFENQLLRIASYISISAITVIYLLEIGFLIFSVENMMVMDVFNALSIVPLGAISVIFGMGLLRLQDGMGRIAKIAGRLEIVFGISYMTLIFSIIGVVLLAPVLIVEVVLLSKADQLFREGGV